jgi:hypothetical protein
MAIADGLDYGRAASRRSDDEPGTLADTELTALLQARAAGDAAALEQLCTESSAEWPA